eukprot:5581327-Pyramimonas_sp.AAC.1
MTIGLPAPVKSLKAALRRLPALVRVTRFHRFLACARSLRRYTLVLCCLVDAPPHSIRTSPHTGPARRVAPPRAKLNTL